MEKRVKIWKLAILFLGIVALSVPTSMKSQEPPDGEFNRLYQDYHEVIIIEDEEGRIIYHNIHIVDCDNPGTNCMSVTVYPD